MGVNVIIGVIFSALTSFGAFRLYALETKVTNALAKVLIAFALVVPLNVVVQGGDRLGLVTYALLVYGQFYIALEEYRNNGNTLVILLCSICAGFWFYLWTQSVVTLVTKVQETGSTEQANVCAVYVLVLLVYTYFIDSELAKQQAPRKWYMILCILGFTAALVRIGLVLVG